MPLIDSHTHGSFCWIELGASSQDAAKRFYGDLFGWHSTDLPLDGESVYTLFHIQNRNVAGCYQLDPKQHLGVPPHWMTYIQAENADATAERAVSLGAKLIVDPFDVFDLGRMAALQDPCGAYFCLWQPLAHRGIAISGVPGAPCWFELLTPNPERAREFYTQLFAWDIHPGHEGNYLHISAGGRESGGILPLSAAGDDTPCHWAPYFLVDDCDTTATRAREMGAQWCMEPTTLPGVGRLATVKDPQGAVFSFIQPAVPAENAAKSERG